jgi:hypothetical protein
MAAVKDKRLHELYAYWSKKCGNKQMPSRGDIDPHDMVKLLPIIFLIEVQDNPQDFRFRLAGTEVCELVGKDITGKLISEVFPPEFCSEVRMHWSSVVEQKKPKSVGGELWVAERNYISWEGIVLPLSPDGNTVTMFIGGGVAIVPGGQNQSRE